MSSENLESKCKIVIENADYRHAAFPTMSHEEVHYKNCDFTGAIFLREKDDISDRPNNRIVFEGCNFEAALIKKFFMRTRFIKCNLNNATFYIPTWEHSRFYECSMDGTRVWAPLLTHVKIVTEEEKSRKTRRLVK